MNNCIIKLDVIPVRDAKAIFFTIKFPHTLGLSNSITIGKSYGQDVVIYRGFSNFFCKETICGRSSYLISSLQLHYTSQWSVTCNHPTGGVGMICFERNAIVGFIVFGLAVCGLVV